MTFSFGTLPLDRPGRYCSRPGLPSGYAAVQRGGQRARLDRRLRDERCARDVDRFGDQLDLEEEIGKLLLGGDDLLRDRFDAKRAPGLSLEQGLHIEASFTGH